MARAGDVLENPVTGLRTIVRRSSQRPRRSSSGVFAASLCPAVESVRSRPAGRLLGYGARYPEHSG